LSSYEDNVSRVVWVLFVSSESLKDLQNTLLKSHEQHLIKYVIDFFESWIIGLHNILLNENDMCLIDFYDDISEFWITHILKLSLKFAADLSVQFLSKTLLIDLNLLWILFNPTLKRLFSGTIKHNYIMRVITLKWLN